ncbi:RHS repeat-associated core domain-containing protein [Streptomyces sp. NPDC004267]|uniref:RHS repeat-associated core domain-containing protein n=1 Tax=Streptomyces sp. NPDC004267 TaxID=3364694 RepID=UPI00368E1BBC
MVLATALSLVVTLADPSAVAVADGKPRNYAVAPEKARPVPVSPVKGRPVFRAKTPQWDPREARAAWPAETTAEAPLTQAPDGRRSAAVRVGTLPVSVAPAASGAQRPVSRVRVRTAGRGLAARAGIAGLITSVARTDGGSGGRVRVSVDYRPFADAYGGDWASRLRLVELPRCVLTTPQRPECRTQTPVASVNDTKTGTVTGEVALPKAASTATVLAALAQAAGGGGSFAATSLSPSGQWSAGGSTGSFSYTYPIGLPDVPGSFKPSIALGYNSQGVDGRTSSTNAQASWIGDGWDYAPGYIERSFRSCADDTAGGTPKTADQCWSDAAQTLTLSLNGASNTLVYDDTSKSWHQQSDSGEKITVKTDTVNGDNDNEYWVVTTADGTDYYFGRNRLPGWATGNPTTNSVWTTPVFGNDTGEPCHQATFAASSCAQAYRWNLDYAVDDHGNAMSFWYTPETGYYGKDNATTPTAYTRGGQLAKIQYGQLSGKVYDTAAPAAGQVFFDTSERCLPDAGFDCAATKLTTTPTRWPDVPADQNCPSTGTCNNHGPSFWTTKRLTGIRTEVLVGTAYQKADSWALTHTFPATGDTTTPSLWLSSITRTGQVGGSLSMPGLTFEGTGFANRVDGLDGYQPITRQRMTKIVSESGGVTAINYLAAQCHRAGTPVMPAGPDNNQMRCYPSYWTPPGQTSPQLDWFNKFVVNTVTEQDPFGGGLPVQTSYTYLGGAAWHFNDDSLTDAKYRTWNQWRGFGQVDVSTGTAPDRLTQSRSVYFRGMKGEKLGTGTWPATLTSSTGGITVDDADVFAGQVFETLSYDGAGGARLASTVTTPALGNTTASHARTAVGLTPLVARRAVDTESTRTTTTKADGTDRVTESDTHYDQATGLPTEVDDKGDLSTAADDKCTTTSYLKDAAGNTLPLPSGIRTVAVACNATPHFPGDLISDDLTFYDGHTDNLAVPTAGDVTMVQKADSVDASGTPHHIPTFKATFDTYGRQLTETDARGYTTTTAYTAATATTPATIKVTQPLVTGQTAAFSSTSVLDPRGLVTKVTDAAGYSTTSAYDPLGRLAAVWKPGFATSNGANTKFTYNLSRSGVSTVTTQTLNDDTSYRTSISLYDALLRARETQTETADGGRVITETVYDTHGWPVKTAGPYYATGLPSGTLDSAPDNQVPTQTGSVYDGAGRVTDAISYNKATETWRTRYAYPGSDRTDVTPPAGSIPTTTFVDARGKTTQLWRYHGSTPTGAYSEVTYAYDLAGRQTGQDDKQGHTWSSTYDLLGRKTSQTDPDTGKTDSTYDNAGQLLTVTDDRDKQVTYTYDELGRRKAQYDTSGNATPSAANMLASWTYDTLKKGLPTSSTSYDNGRAYTDKILGYDASGRVTATARIIPAEEGNLQGNYITQNRYNLTGTLSSYTDTAAGMLPQETVSYGYDRFGRQKTAGSESMTASLDWTPYDEPQQFTLGTSGNFAQQTLQYDDQTHRLASSFTVAASGTKVADRTTYAYQPSGNVTRITSDPGDGTTDTQCFRYDWAQRLAAAWTATDACAATPQTGVAGTVSRTASSYWQTWTYDGTGNRETQTDRALDGDATQDTVSTYTEPAAGKGPAHAVASVSKAAPGGPENSLETTYTYDASGNVGSRTNRGGTDTFTFNTLGKLSKLSRTATSTSTTYVYDAAGNLLIRRDADKTVLFTGDQELTLKSGAAKAEGTRYIGLGGQTVAVHTADAGGDRVAYLVSDRQGTGQLQIDAASQAVTRRQFKPFGEKRTTAANWQGSRGFVGGQEDEDTGLVNLGARQYDPAAGRFLSPDPLIDPGDPEQWNAYGYANNSPVTLSDPDGLCPKDWDICGVSGQSPSVPPTKKEIDDYNRYNNYAKPTPSSTTTHTDSATAKAEAEAADRAKATADAAAAAARKEKEGFADKIVNLVADLIGITDAVNCFTKGDVMACINTALNAVPWGKVFKAIKVGYKAFKLWRSIEKAEKAVKEAEDAAAAAAVLARERRAQAAAAEAEEAAAASAPACLTHSFTGNTPVLLADGTTKPISEIEPGDQVAATDPQTDASAVEPVERQIVTKDDTEFTDLTVVATTRPTTPKTPTAKPEKPAKLTTTWHHPFWNVTKQRWTEAKQLTPGTELRRPEGTTVRVVHARNYNARAITYDLTVRRLHSYYVLAGAAPVLVHNCGTAYRGMEMAEDGLPELGSSAKKLGVRVDGNADVHPSAHGTVAPGEGMSAATSPQGLPVHRRPASFGGSGKNMQMFSIKTRDLPEGLTAVQDGKTHVTIGPAYEMPLAQFEELLASTRNLWSRV